MRSLLISALLLSIAACSSSTADEDSEDGAHAASLEGMSSEVVGSYALETPSIGATLEVTSVEPFKFNLVAVRKQGGGNFGELDAARATVFGNKAKFQSGNDCTITLERVGTDLVVKQTGSCSSADFGNGVDASGTYKKKTVAAPSDRTGKYTLPPSNSLEIKKLEPFTFDLFVLAAGSSGRHGEIVDGKAELRGDVATFTAGDDCKIEMKLGEGAVDIRQEGLCTSADFGAFVDASGHYKR